ncbi:Nucleotidyltransferase domain-containing protein [Nitrosomonas communis]|uniref:Nucleotidyltransferase domain-containing protein n=2 Tax=Nitrosomonas communis TaxID=44574 RepID=A0A1I4JXD5_9PROT|nr:Nucleotidyltransferase domain-containing protein [Nitrosomonas communis]
MANQQYPTKYGDDTVSSAEQLIRLILNAWPDTQAIYLFGSWGTEYERPESDVDIAVLLPPKQAKEAGSLLFSELHQALQTAVNRDVDLINLRLAPTVLQKEIIMGGERLFQAPGTAVDEFEMLVLSLYQKLNEERAGILAEGLRSGKFYDL